MEKETQEIERDNRVFYLAQKFHNYYEELAPKFGYETREDKKVFDPESKNGKLMMEVCKKILSDLIS